MSEQFSMDGYLSAVLGPQGGANNTVIIHSPESLYDSGGVYARVVDLPAERAMSGGLIIEGDTEELALSELERLDAAAAFTEALRWSALQGGAVIVLVTDQGALEDELNMGALNAVLELRAYPVTKVGKGESTYSDASKPKYGMPIKYEIKPQAGQSYWVHESRLLFVPGDPLATTDSSGLHFRGRIGVKRAYAALLRYDEACRKAMQILERKQQAVYGMTGMAKSLATAERPGAPNVGEQLVQKRINFVDSARGVLNTVAIDGDDKYTIQDLALSNIDTVIGEMQVSASAEAGIPVTLLFGRSPAGMNATGAADFKGYNAMVDGLRERKTRPALERLISIIYAQSSLKGDKPTDWHLDFPQLEEMTDKELAEIGKTNAETRKIDLQALEVALQTGAVTEEQAAAWIAENEWFGLKPEDDGTDAKAKKYAQQT